MRQSASGKVAPYGSVTMPSGTTIAAGNSWGSLAPVFGSPNDTVVVCWDKDSFGPRGNLRCEAVVESTGQVLVYVWNPGANPVTTGFDLSMNIQIIPRG